MSGGSGAPPGDAAAERPLVVRSPGERSTERERATEAGSGSVLVLALMGVLAIVTGCVTVIGSAVIARHQAEAAADLAALAAVAQPAACRRAARVALAGGGRLLTCEQLSDGSVLVSVAVPVGWPLPGDSHPPTPPLAATAWARAGR